MTSKCRTVEARSRKRPPREFEKVVVTRAGHLQEVHCNKISNHFDWIISKLTNLMSSKKLDVDC